MKTTSLALIAGVSGVVILALAMSPGPGAWVAPKEADALKNPVLGDAAATAAGKVLYTKLCTVCHGDKGKGDGPAGIALTPRPADHSSAIVQAQTDGAIFWKITTGRAPMASYKTSLTDVQRWQLVNYMRELGKPKPKKK